MFLVYVCTTWALVLTHVFIRTQGLFGMRGGARLLFGIVWFLLGFAYIPVRIFIGAYPSDTITVIPAHGAAFIIGLAAILWTLLVFLEAAAALLWLVKRHRLKNASPRIRRTTAAVWWAASGILAIVGILSAHATPSITRLQVSIRGADRERLVVISDTHLGAISSIDQWRRTLKEAQAQDPHALIMAGDLIDDRTARAEKQMAMIREFFPEKPVYVVTGNHERYAGLDFFERLCKRHCFRLLRRDSEAILPGLSIAGVDDNRGDIAQSAVKKALSGTDGALLFITHRPEAAHFLRDRPMTLAVAGHTHGGQIPPVVFLAAFGNGGFFSGYYRVGQAHLYVSRGAGVWGPPMRLLAPSEIVVIEVCDGAEFDFRLKVDSIQPVRRISHSLKCLR